MVSASFSGDNFLLVIASNIEEIDSCLSLTLSDFFTLESLIVRDLSLFFNLIAFFTHLLDAATVCDDSALESLLLTSCTFSGGEEVAEAGISGDGSGGDGNGGDGSGGDGCGGDGSGGDGSGEAG